MLPLHHPSRGLSCILDRSPSQHDEMEEVIGQELIDAHVLGYSLKCLWSV